MKGSGLAVGIHQNKLSRRGNTWCLGILLFPFSRRAYSEADRQALLGADGENTRAREEANDTLIYLLQGGLGCQSNHRRVWFLSNQLKQSFWREKIIRKIAGNRNRN